MGRPGWGRGLLGRFLRGNLGWGLLGEELCLEFMADGVVDCSLLLRR